MLASPAARAGLPDSRERAAASRDYRRSRASFAPTGSTTEGCPEAQTATRSETLQVEHLKLAQYN